MIQQVSHPVAKSRVGAEVWGALILGTTLNPLNSSMVAVAVIPIRRHFDVSDATATWIIISFYAAACVAQPLMGRLADQLGPRRVFRSGMVLALLAAVGAALAPSFAFLVVMRVLQSVGTSAAYPSAVFLLRLHDESPAGLATAGTIAAAVGPVVGGLAILIGGWPVIFWLNVPLVLAAGIILGLRGGRDSPLPKFTTRDAIRLVDPVGTLSFSTAATLLVVFLLSLSGSVSWWALWIGALASVIFFVCETTIAQPIIEVRALAAHRRLLATDAQFFLFNFVYYGTFFGLPQWLEEAQGYSPGHAGLVMFPLAAFTAVGAALAQAMLRRTGLGRTQLLSYGVLFGGLACLFVLESHPSSAMMAAVGFVLGVPYGVAGLAFQASMVKHTPTQLAGVSAGLFQTSRYAGGITASVAIGLLFTAGSPTHGLESLTWVLLATCALMTIPAVFERRHTSGVRRR
jgi:MFS family permease